MRNRILQKRNSVQICCFPFTHFSVVECEAGPEIEVGAAILYCLCLQASPIEHTVSSKRESVLESVRG